MGASLVLPLPYKLHMTEVDQLRNALAWALATGQYIERRKGGPASRRYGGRADAEARLLRIVQRDPHDAVAAVLFLDRDGRGPSCFLVPHAESQLLDGHALDFVAGANGRETAEREHDHDVRLPRGRRDGKDLVTHAHRHGVGTDGLHLVPALVAPTDQERAHRLDVRRHRRFLLGLRGDG